MMQNLGWLLVADLFSKVAFLVQLDNFGNGGILSFSMTHWALVMVEAVATLALWLTTAILEWEDVI